MTEHRPQRIVIIGFGPVAASLVEGLLPAAASGQCAITVISAEDHLAYNRVLLAELAVGAAELEHLGMVDPQRLADAGVEVRLGVRATGIDRALRAFRGALRGPVELQAGLGRLEGAFAVDEDNDGVDAGAGPAGGVGEVQVPGAESAAGRVRVGAAVQAGGEGEVPVVGDAAGQRDGRFRAHRGRSGEKGGCCEAEGSG